jgi:soluble lytic murein transglycosylase-like protein
MRSTLLVLPGLTLVLAGRSWAGDHAEAAYYADAYARHYHVPAELVHAIIRQESNWNQHAISNKNARGLMQLMPGTAARFGVRNPLDMSQNVGGGVRYLHALLGQYHGDVRLAVAAYYAGEHRIHSLQYSNAEVIRYVQEVRERYLQELSARRISKESYR